jgi:small-conductance mechanosensitive channel
MNEFAVFSTPVSTEQILVSVGLVVVASLAGVIFDKVLITRLKIIVSKTKWTGDDVIIGSLRTISGWMGLIAGIYLGAMALPLLPEVQILVNKVIWVMITVWITIFTGRIVIGFIRSYSSQNKGLVPNTSILVNIARIVIYVIGFLAVLQTLGVSITPMLTALGVGGLAVALALQTTLSNLFAGIQLLASKHIHPGDYVQLESGDEGYITDITWRSTSIRALPNRVIVIPNDVLASTVIKNFSLPEEQIAVLIDMSVAYDSDLEKVEIVTSEVARETMLHVNGAVSDFEPFIRYNTFAESGIGFTVIMRAQEYANQYAIKHNFIKAVCERYRREQIEIPYPVRVVKYTPREH